MRLTALVLLLLSSAAVVAAPVDVQVTEDAEADWIAVSVFGNATCPYLGHCRAVSGTGTASNGSMAVSGTGNASTCTTFCYAVSGTGDAEGVIPLGTGRCRDHPTQPWRPCAAAGSGAQDVYWLAVTPDQDGKAHWAAVSGGDAEGGVVAVAAGGAEACQSSWPCVGAASIQGPSSGAMAVSVAGDATGCTVLKIMECGAVSVLGDAHCVGLTVCPAVSATGAATGGSLAVSGTNDAEACTDRSQCVTISATGHARGGTAVSGCDTLAAHGEDAACIDPV